MNAQTSCQSSRAFSDGTEPQPGDILLFCRARQWNKLITWFTRSPYYHAAIYQGDGHVVEARPRGVVARDLNGPDGDKSFDVIVLPHDRQKCESALQWAQSQIGAPYDKADIAVIVIERLLKTVRLKRADRSQFSCGELVACAFENAGVRLFPDREASEIVPADFAVFLPENIREKRAVEN